MKVKPSKKIAELGAYAFAEMDKQVARLKAEGHDPIDFGVGDPTIPTPEFILAAAAEGLERHKAGGYPSYEGEPAFRRAAADWMERRLAVSLDPDREINITLGSKEAIFNVHEAFVEPGDAVISPSPGYPPYGRGARFAAGQNHYYPLTAKKDFLPDLDAIPEAVAKEAGILWICQPHVPTGRVLDGEVLDRLVHFCRRHEILLCSDEAYLDLYYEEKPDSLIQHAREGILVFYSLSKRSAMTGFRCGWVAGDPEAIAHFRRLKTNIDSGVPKFIQDAAVAALDEERHVDHHRRAYRARRDLLVKALTGAGLPPCRPQAGLYIWQRAPEGMNGVILANRLLEPDLCLITAPGAWLSDPVQGLEENPGEHYIRLAFVPPLERIEQGASRLGKVKLHGVS